MSVKRFNNQYTPRDKKILIHMRSPSLFMSSLLSTILFQKKVAAAAVVNNLSM
jgi:hypothetical protein